MVWSVCVNEWLVKEQLNGCSLTNLNRLNPKPNGLYLDCRTAKPHVTARRGNLCKSNALGTGKRGRCAKKHNLSVERSATLEIKPKVYSIGAAANNVEVLSNSNPEISIDPAHGMNSCDSKPVWRNDCASDTPETVSRESIQECCPASLDGTDPELGHIFEPETTNLIFGVSAADLSAAITSCGNSPDNGSRAVPGSDDSSSSCAGCACRQMRDLKSPEESSSLIETPATVLQSEINIMQMESGVELDRHGLDCSRGAEGIAGPCVSGLSEQRLVDRPNDSENQIQNEVRPCCETDSEFGPCRRQGEPHQLESDIRFSSAILQER